MTRAATGVLPLLARASMSHMVAIKSIKITEAMKVVIQPPAQMVTTYG